MTHTVAAATRGAGSYVIVPNFQKDFFHGEARQSGYKTADKFNTGNSDHCLFIGFIISGMERNIVFSNRDDPGIGDGNAVCIASKIFNGIIHDSNHGFLLNVGNGVDEFKSFLLGGNERTEDIC